MKTHQIPLNDEKTWDLICNGYTRGCFQIDSNLGRAWCKRIKPRNIEELATVISAIRPGSLKAKLEGKSLTQHFADRKHNIEEIPEYHPIIDKILEKTYGIILYQEQIIEIAQKIAGFDLKSADLLRKSIGKKLPEEMSKLKSQFLEGCKTTNTVSDEQAEELFNWIEKSQRYLFNKCISGKIKIKKTNGNLADSSIEELYNNKKNYGKCWSIDEYGTIVKNTIKDIRYSGVQQLFRITLKSGKYIDVTENHKFPIQDITLTTKELSIGSYLSVFDKAKYHQIWQNGKQYHKKTHIRQTEQIISIEPIGEDDVYDVEVEGPYHNFAIENGIFTSNSHAISYAITGYWCAYRKIHNPILFFTTWLSYAKFKPKKYEEIRNLIEDAKFMELPIFGPDLRQKNADFITDNTNIWYGLSNIKGVGDTTIKKLTETYDNWLDFLIKKSDTINSIAVKALICSGAIDYFELSRTQMLYEYEKWNLLTAKEKQWANNNFTRNETLVSLLEKLSPTKKNGGGTSNKNRSEIVNSVAMSLKNPSQSMTDDPYWIIDQEHKLLGIPLTYSRTEMANTIAATHTCKQILQGVKSEYIIIGVEIQAKRDYIIKSGQWEGKKMYFLTVSDDTAAIDNVLVFPSKFEEFYNLLNETSVVLMKVSQSKKGGLIVQEVW